MSTLLPRVASDEAVFLLESEVTDALVGEVALRDVALENHANGLETFLVGGGGNGEALASGGGGGGG